jgi:hypothetical protein
MAAMPSAAREYIVPNGPASQSVPPTILAPAARSPSLATAAASPPTKITSTAPPGVAKVVAPMTNFSAAPALSVSTPVIAPR